MTFYETITAAVADITLHGFDSPERMEYWSREIRRAALAVMMPEAEMERQLRENFRAIYKRMIDEGQILKRHPQLSRFTLDSLAPKLHADLERRIYASANLIKLNRAQSVEKTLQRFQGWASSVPKGGAQKTTDKKDVKQDIRKSLAQLPFEERRVIIDQGTKFVSSLNETIALGGNAIAAIWHSHWRQAGYNYREDHKEIDKHIFTIRGNWAIDRGLMKKGEHYTDEISKPAELPFCRCFYQYIYSLADLPPDMLTDKGKSGISEAKAITHARR